MPKTGDFYKQKHFLAAGGAKMTKETTGFVCFVPSGMEKSPFSWKSYNLTKFQEISLIFMKISDFAFLGPPSPNPTYSLLIPMVFRGPRGLKTRKTTKIEVFHENTIKLVIFHEIDRKFRFLPILKKFLISGPPGEPKYLWNLQGICMFLSRCPQEHPKTTNFMKIHQFSPIFIEFHQNWWNSMKMVGNWWFPQFCGPRQSP